MPTLSKFITPAQKEEVFLGETTVRKGLVAAIILAAGEGTRLGFSKPKGLFPVLQGKSLLELKLEKIVRKERKFKRALPTYIMCSKKNHPSLKAFLEENQFFGAQCVKLFDQTEKPLFQSVENELRETDIYSPDGNGAIFESAQKAGVLSDEAKVYTVTFIDNPLADPFDEALLGRHVKEKNDATFIVIDQKEKQEKMGAVIEDKGRLKIVEYTENVESSFFNTGILCFSKSHMLRSSRHRLPYHLVCKKWGGKSFFKYERFIFDSFQFAQKIGAISKRRQLCYAPLKEKTGPCGIKAVQNILKGVMT